METAVDTESSLSSRALALISASNLEYPKKNILEAFITDAVDPELAAEYLLRVTGLMTGIDNGLPKDVELSHFLDDWTALVDTLRPTECKGLARDIKAIVRARDGGRCCITGLRPRFYETQLVLTSIVPPSAFSCERTTHDVEQNALKNMLEAFITPAKWDRLCTLLESRVSSDGTRRSETHLVNLWLLSSDVYDVFREGELYLKALAHPDSFPRNHPAGCLLSPLAPATDIEIAGLHQSYDILYSHLSPVIWFWGPKHIVHPISVTLCNQAPLLSPLPNPELLGFHARLSKAMKYMTVSEQIKNGWPHVQKRIVGLDKFLFYLLRHIWVKVPSVVRARTYGLLRKLGEYFYGAQAAGTQRLPFNLYLKVGDPDRTLNEARAMDLVERYTEIPAPRVIDEVYSPQFSYLLMTRVSGTALGPFLHRLSDAEVRQAGEDLKRHLSQLRRIPNPFSPQSIICGAAGKGVYDYRINSSTDRSDMKFESEAKFNECLLSDVPNELHERAALSHSIPHQIVFTHGDLNMRNVLMEGGRISAIVDWENAGWFPEYWEYTKVHYTISRTRRYLDDIVEVAFGGYQKELEVEKMLFRYVDPF